jgi:predicted TIM-barrel fold metal-dependent hydrolase
MIIDAHVHLGAMPLFRVEGRVEDLLRAADRNGIDKLFCTEATALFYDFREGNRRLFDIMRRYPDRILGYCTISSARYGPQAVEEVDRCAQDYGMRGLKIYSFSVPGTREPFLSVDDEWMYPIIEKAAAYRMVILAHCNAEEIGHLASLFPHAILVMAHMGNTAHARGDWHGAIAVARRYPNIYLETSTSSTDFDCVETAVALLGAERIVFGSDWPLFSHEFALARIRETALSPEEQALILGGNLRRVLGL